MGVKAYKDLHATHSYPACKVRLKAAAQQPPVAPKKAIKGLLLASILNTESKQDVRSEVL